MKVRIVCYEGWISEKFSTKLQENLARFDIQSDIGKSIDLKADINHHIIYLQYDGSSATIDTLMITHIDTIAKQNTLKKQLSVACMGICMSRESMVNLVNAGVCREKICYINPAHDEVMQPRPTVIGLASRVYEDGRKREYFLVELAKKLNPKEFSFKIMGAGWDKYVSFMREKRFNVEYYNSFDYLKYVNLIPTLDYYLYMGMDEGQMGFIDALAAGVKTIVTPQGYHLDAEGGITYGFKSLKELIEIFHKISEEKKRLVNSVAGWNWYNYTKKHVEIWEYLLYKNSGKKYLCPTNDYRDGIHSIFEFEKQPIERLNLLKRLNNNLTLFAGYCKHKYFFIRNIKGFNDLVSIGKRINIKSINNFIFKK